MKIKLKPKHIITFIGDLSLRQKRVLTWVVKAHGEQTRKYTGELYFNHPLAVAYIASLFDKSFGIIEVSLLHDVVEDTEWTTAEIGWMLAEAGYYKKEIQEIILGVRSLTDVYTHENYPNINRAQRKIKESLRLARIDEKWQTIKYADLFHNTNSIVKYDPLFATTYLKEKDFALRQMRKGNVELYGWVWRQLRKANSKLL